MQTSDSKSYMVILNCKRSILLFVYVYIFYKDVMTDTSFAFMPAQGIGRGSEIDHKRGLEIERRVKAEDTFILCYKILEAEIFYAGISCSNDANDTKNVVSIKDMFENRFDEYELVKCLMKFIMYLDKHGMVPCRSREDGNLPEIVDFFSGKFIRYLEADGTYTYSWFDNQKNIIDGSVVIYVDLVHGPCSCENDPYRSLISTILPRLKSMYWRRFDHDQMFFQVSHPPFGVMASPHMKSTTKIDQSENAYTDAAIAGAEGMSIVATSDRKYNEDMTETVNKHFADAELRCREETERTIIAPDGKQLPISYMHAWAVRRVEMPVGYEPANFQPPQYVPIEDQENALSLRIRNLMGVTSSDSESGGRKLEAHVKSQKETLNRTVVERRKQIAHVFKFLYSHFLRKSLVSTLEKKKKASYEVIEKVPSTYLEYYRWMVKERKLREHSSFNRDMMDEENERERAFIEKVEQTANKLILEADGERTYLDRDVVISHLLTIMKKTTEIAVIDRKLDKTEVCELVFTTSNARTSETILEMYSNGLIPPNEASFMMLRNEGIEERTAEEISRACTGISPTDTAKLELEYKKLEVQKMATENKRKEGEGGKVQKPSKKSKTK